MNTKIILNEDVVQAIDENLEYLPEILSYISTKLKEYREKCEKQNSSLMINALGEACQILAMKKRPSDKEMKKYCKLIKEAQFPNGIQSWHHQGEKDFYNRFLKDK